MPTDHKILLMTIGVGDAANPEETLYSPLRKSIAQGEWERVILLPSMVSADRAEHLRAGAAGLPIEIRPLPEPGMEDDADACFAHFDAVLASLAEAGVPPERVVADFTRGTKAMTAALTLAAAGRGVESLRYITGKRDARGTVTPGTERIHDFQARRVTFRRDLDLAARFLEAWQFRGAERLASVTDEGRPAFPEGWLEESRRAAWLARFWGAWDRFDYGEAVRLLGERPDGDAPAMLARLEPDERRMDFIRELAVPLPAEPRLCAEPVRNLAADTLENGRRRLALGELEDALIRAYRVLELIGQIRLFTHGQDSGRISADWPPVRAWIEYKKAKSGKKPAKLPVLNDKGCYELGRVQVASLLKHLGDALEKPLNRAQNWSGLEVRARNNSNLIHGFRAQATTEKARDLEAAYARLAGLFIQEDPGNEHRLARARFPFGPAPSPHGRARQ